MQSYPSSPRFPQQPQKYRSYSELKVVQFFIQSTRIRKQLAVFSGFYNAALVQNDDAIRVLNCGQPMRNDNRSTACHQMIDSLLNKNFRFSIKRGCCFIKNQDRRVFENCPRQRQSLTLTTRKFYTAFADQDRKSTRLNSSHGYISYAVFCL